MSLRKNLRKYWFLWSNLTFRTSGLPSFKEDEESFRYDSVHHLCLFNSEIVTYIHAAHSEYIVYDSIEGGSVIISGTEERLKMLDRIIPDLSALKGFLTSGEMNRFKQRIAGAVRLSLIGKPKKARKVLANIQRKAIQLRTNKFRLAYLIGAMILSLLVGIVTWLYQYYDLSFGTKWQELRILNLLLFSSIGGIFSVAIGYKQLATNIPEAGNLTYVVHGASRIFISLLAGIAGYVLMEANVLFGNFKDEKYGLLCLAILAGFTETLIPSLLDKSSADLDTTD
ncbi:MAG: hypothetical protein ACPF9D_04860 [Owenweeksia sp.]